MSKILLPPNHYIFTSVKKVQQICNPLFANDKFSFFDYARFSKQGEFYGFTTNGDSFRIFFDLEYESLKSCKRLLFDEDRLYYFYSPPPDSFSNSDDSYAAQEILRVTGSDHGFSIINKQGDFIDAYYFSSPLPRDVAINYYLSQLPMLHKFITYFHNEASHLIETSNENRIILSDKMRPKLWDCSLKIESDKINLLNNIENINHLTKREMECAKYISQGYTIKEVARLLILSPRTVETHLERLKNKLNIRKKSELVRYLLQHEIFK